MKLDRTRHLLAITLSIISMGYLLFACDSKQDAQTHVNLGNVYMNQEKLDQAIVQYQKAIEIDPNLGLAHNNLGQAYGRFSIWFRVFRVKKREGS